MLAPTLRRDLSSTGPSPYQQSTRVLDSWRQHPPRIINDRANQPYQDQRPDPVRGLRINIGAPPQCSIRPMQSGVDSCVPAWQFGALLFLPRRPGAPPRTCREHHNRLQRIRAEEFPNGHRPFRAADDRCGSDRSGTQVRDWRHCGLRPLAGDLAQLAQLISPHALQSAAGRCAAVAARRNAHPHPRDPDQRSRPDVADDSAECSHAHGGD